MPKPVTRDNPASWLAAIWEALDMVEMPEAMHDEVCTAMAWIAEELNVTTEQIEAESE